MRVSRVVIVINRDKSHAHRTAEALREILDDHGVKHEWRDTLKPGAKASKELTDLCSVSADLIIACGGDGTLIQTAHRSRGSGVPILGINIGYLGFITSVLGGQVKSAMRRILKADYVVSNRTALDLEVIHKGKGLVGWALNDAVIIRGANPHLIDITARVGKRPFTKYRCDGLIVATPTGSTAYSLAAGGPIVSPECNVLTVTPICPHSLTNRSVVINSSETIELKAHGAGEVQVDGMLLSHLTEDGLIRIKTSKDVVPIAFLPEINHYDTLAEKLGWTGNGLRL